MLNEIQEIQIKIQCLHNIIKNLILLGTYYKYKTIIFNFLQTNESYYSVFVAFILTPITETNNSLKY